MADKTPKTQTAPATVDKVEASKALDPELRLMNKIAKLCAEHAPEVAMRALCWAQRKTGDRMAKPPVTGAFNGDGVGGTHV